MSVPLSFGWRHLLFANWPVDPVAVAPHLPAGLAVETFDGRAWLSAVAFRNVDTRPRGAPAILGVDFAELNLRTYVAAGDEPGVYFFSLDAPSLPGVLGARLLHRLPYYYASVDLAWEAGRARFRSRRRHPGARPARFDATYEPDGDAFTPEPGTLAAFLTERRRLYTESQGGRLRHTDVRHAPWTLYPASATIGANTLLRANRFAEPGSDPIHYYSPGVDVWTTSSRIWRGSGE